MLFVSEDGNKFGMSVGERNDVRVRVEVVPGVEYRMKSDDMLRLVIRKSGVLRSEPLAVIEGRPGSNTIEVRREDTEFLRPGVYTAVILLDSPTNEYENKWIWPRFKEKDIKELNPHFPYDNFLLTAGGGEL